MNGEKSTIESAAGTWEPGRRLAAALAFVLVAWVVPLARGAEIHSICTVKGQEPVRLTGLGLVVGLNGSGDTRFTPMHAAIARALDLLGNPVGDLRDVTAIRNVALVSVQCEIPGAGGREGERFDAFVSSIGTAKSLAGGRLLRASLRGPITIDEKVYATAEGAVSIESRTDFNQGRIKDGSQLVEDFFSPFLRETETITLVLDPAHSTFSTANRVASAINSRIRPQVSRDGQLVTIAQAVDQKNIVVAIPPFAQSNVVAFVADVMQTQLDPDSINTQARVVINERSGTIVVTGEVELTPVLLSQRNLILFPPGTIPVQTTANEFTPLINAGPPANAPLPAQLNDLLVALNRAQVSADDKIAIVKELAKSGKLHAKVSFE